MPEFTVIFPIYNVEKYVEKSLKSILKQTFQDFELICVNDCTQDNSMQIIEKFAQNDSRIKIIHHSENKGLGAARNTALNEASGKYIVCVDSDDWVENNFLEKIHQAFAENDVDSVMVKYWVYEELIDYAHISILFPAFAHFPGGKYLFTPDNITNHPSYAWNKAYKTEIIRENYYQWMEGVFYEDVFFYFNYLINHPKTYIINEMLYYYRQRENSITKNKNISYKKLEDMFKVLKMLYKTFDAQMQSEEAKQAVLTYAKQFRGQYVNTKNEKLTELMYSKFLCEIN